MEFYGFKWKMPCKYWLCCKCNRIWMSFRHVWFHHALFLHHHHHHLPNLLSVRNLIRILGRFREKKETKNHPKLLFGFGSTDLSWFQNLLRTEFVCMWHVTMNSLPGCFMLAVGIMHICEIICFGLSLGLRFKSDTSCDTFVIHKKERLSLNIYYMTSD